MFDAIGPFSIGAIAIDPQDPDRIYVGTGEANASGDSFPGAGLFVSTDAGNTWTSLGLETTRHIGRIAVDPMDADLVYVAAVGALFSTGPDRGLYRTTDGGMSWTQHLALTDSTGVIDVLIESSAPARGRSWNAPCHFYFLRAACIGRSEWPASASANAPRTTICAGRTFFCRYSHRLPISPEDRPQEHVGIRTEIAPSVPTARGKPFGRPREDS